MRIRTTETIPSSLTGSFRNGLILFRTFIFVRFMLSCPYGDG